MKNTKYFVYLLIMIACSCKSIETEKLHQINLENITEKSLDISSVVDSIWFIKLETSEDCLISNIQDICFIEDRIFINDNAKRLLVFNREGKFLNTIGRAGKGPGEFASIAGFSVDPVNKTVYILNGKKLQGYNFEGDYNGFLISTNLHTSLFFHDNLFYCYTPKELLFFDRSENHNITIFDTTGRKVNTFLPVAIPAGPPMFITVSDFYLIENSVMLLDPEANKVYEVDSSGINMRYEFFYGNPSKNDSTRVKNQSQITYKNDSQNKDMMKCGKILESENSIIIYYRFGNASNMAYIDLTDNSITNVKTVDDKLGFEDDIFQGPTIRPKYIFNNSWIDVVQPVDIIEESGNENVISILTSKYNLSVNDNPLLRFCRLKKRK
ncbi:MAG: 6-bladed beta-propeller [Bacteroidales bacterium]|nr:6-bladed beta-propeller [Bacteroidales bacterium]